MSRNFTTPARVRTAARITASLLALVAALHVYWAFGGEWALSTATAGATKSTSAGFQVFSAVIAFLAVAAAIEILALADAAGGRLRRISSTKLVWTMVVILAIGGIARTASAPAIGISAIVLAALFATVVGGTSRPSDRPPHRGT